METRTAPPPLPRERSSRLLAHTVGPATILWLVGCFPDLELLQIRVSWESEYFLDEDSRELWGGVHRDSQGHTHWVFGYRRWLVWLYR